MKKKSIIVIVTTIIVLLGAFIILNVSTETEHIVEGDDQERIEIEPEEEVSEEVDYETIIKLYFYDSTSGVMCVEDRKVDARNLIDNPYLYVLNLLIQGPENNNLVNRIPEGTKVNSASLESGTINIDLSESFLNGGGTDHIYSIVNTMCEFNEIDNVKITINGKEKEGIKEKFVRVN